MVVDCRRGQRRLIIVSMLPSFVSWLGGVARAAEPNLAASNGGALNGVPERPQAEEASRRVLMTHKSHRRADQPLLTPHITKWRGSGRVLVFGGPGIRRIDGRVCWPFCGWLPELTEAQNGQPRRHSKQRDP